MCALFPEEQVLIESFLVVILVCVDQAKRKERMVKGMLQKQMMSVAEQQQRLNKVRTELEKLEMVRDFAFPPTYDFHFE